MDKLNEKMIEIHNPYPVKMEEIIDLVERSTRLIHTTTDSKTIQLYIYSTGRDRPDYLAEVEITSAGYILHDDDGFYYQGSTFKEFQNDLREVVFHFEAVVFKRLNESNDVPKITFKVIEDALYQWYLDHDDRRVYRQLFDIVKSSPKPSFGLVNEIAEKIEDRGYDADVLRCYIYNAIKENKKSLKETVDSTSAAFNLTKLKGYLRFETKWEYDEDFLEDAMLVDKVHEPPRFTVKWIGPEGKKHPNTYCVRIRRDTGESWDWETHYFLKASDAAEMINLEVGTWEHNNMSWKFESKAALFDNLLEAIEDFPKNTRAMYRFARRRHNDTGAIRKVSKQPYWVHPEGVAKIVMEHGGSDIEIKAAMAHDTMEDAGVSYDDMVEKFGEKVASIVREVTNDNDEIAKIGKERYISEELCRLSPEALTVKLADMLYNMKDSPTEKNYERMRKNVAFLMMNRKLDGKHLELAREIMEV